MQIRIADCPPEGLHMQDRLDPGGLKDLAALQESESCQFNGPLSVALTVTPTAGMFAVEGRIRGRVTLACSRCLAPAECPIKSFFKLTFSRRIPADEPDAPSETRQLQSEEMGVVLFEGDAIDFRDVIQEQVIMTIPMRPLCREDCRGLCPRCGTDLNHEACDCDRKEVDPRLAALKQLKFDV
jgi:uncharacterized protein